MTAVQPVGLSRGRLGSPAYVTEVCAAAAFGGQLLGKFGLFSSPLPESFSVGFEKASLLGSKQFEVDSKVGPGKSCPILSVLARVTPSGPPGEIPGTAFGSPPAGADIRRLFFFFFGRGGVVDT